MKFQQFLQFIADRDGFIPSMHLRWVIHQNPRNTAREEAIAATILEQANPRENITGHFPWGPEQNMVLQQLWFHPHRQEIEWRDIPVKDAQELYSVVSTEHGDLPVPNAVKEPETVRADFQARLKEILGEDYEAEGE